jgi:TRAP-type mannitol/chloroaromatic compound transport system substrate-binding protein
MGLDRAAKYYYFPGWHEPGTQLELIINEEAWNSLPADLKVIVKAAAASASLYMFGQSEVLNAEAFNLLKEKQHIEILEFPPQVLSYLAGFTEEVMLEEASNNENFDKVLKSYQKFRNKRKNFEQVTDRAYKKALEYR